MSQSESVVPSAPHGSASRTSTDDFAARIGTRPVPEREGLPQTYRMRADAHYVDQLESPRQQVVRLVETAQIDSGDLPRADRVEPLTKSIAEHGVLQPLLIRKQGGRYSLIAGRKRLAAAVAAGLSAVPCLLHEIDATAAAALAAADNLRPDEETTAAAERAVVHPVLHAVSSELATIVASTALLGGRQGGGLPRQVGAAIIETQAARAAWMVTALLGTFEASRQLPLGVILHGVSDRFSSHASVSGLDLEITVSPAAAVWRLPEGPVAAAITGAVHAALSYLDGTPRPRIEIHADAVHTRSLKIEVVQRVTRPAPVSGLLADSRTSEADLIPALALRLAKQVAANCGGQAELTMFPGRGSVLQMVFPAVPASL